MGAPGHRAFIARAIVAAEKEFGEENNSVCASLLALRCIACVCFPGTTIRQNDDG